MNKINNIEDIDDMKTMWVELNKRLTQLEDTNKKLCRDIKNSRYKSSIDNLISRYRKFIIIALVSAIIFPIFIYSNPLVVDKYRNITAIYWLVFFLMEMSFDVYLMQRLRSINIYESSINQIAQITCKTWRIHKYMIAIGLPIALGACCLFALALDANYFTILGMIVGGILGVCIGIGQLIKFKTEYKNLQNDED